MATNTKSGKVEAQTGTPVSADKKETKSTAATAKDAKVVSETKTVSKGESIYTVNELALNAVALFGKNPECVSAALREKGKTSCTKSEAQRIVQDFLKKEVK